MKLTRYAVMSKLAAFLSVLVFLSLMLHEDRQAFAADEFHKLEVQIEGKGLAMIEAQVDFPAPPDVVFTVLTDYPNWPKLFPDGVEVEVERKSGRSVVMDMKIPQRVLSGKMRLKAKWRETPPHKLETTLIEGDFLRYEQVWQLTPMQDGKYTRAELNLTLQPKGWIMKVVPEFLYKWALREDLKEHFEKFRKQVWVKKGKGFRERRNVP